MSDGAPAARLPRRLSMRARGLTPGSHVLRQDLVEAGDAVAARLQVAPGSPVVLVEREPLAVPADAPGFLFSSAGEDERGGVVYWATSLFRGDRYEIRLRQNR